MAISPLLSIAGTALAPLARDVVEQISAGLSFQKLLGRDDASRATDATAPITHSTASFPASPAAAQLEAIRRQPLQELETLVDRLRERLSAAGIDLSEAIPLKVGNRGDLQVDANHPDRATIEDLLAADSQLTSTFRLVANALTSQHNATSGDPISTEFRLTIDASGFNLAFE